MTLPKDERKERIEKDTKHYRDTVYLKDHGDGWRAYHEEKDCERFPDEFSKFMRGEAQYKGYYPCKYCVLDYKKGGGNGGGKSNLEHMIDNGLVDETHIGVNWKW